MGPIALRLACALLLAVLGACDGTIGDTVVAEGVQPIDPATPRWLHEEDLPTTERLESYARLTRSEYRFVLTDLLAGAPQDLQAGAFASVEALPQNTYESYYNNYADINVDPQLAANLYAISAAAAEAFVRSDWFDSLCGDRTTCIGNVVAELLPRIWKRRVSSTEANDLAAFAQALPEEGRMRRLFTRVFLSPYFHFKVFPSAPETADEANLKRAQLLSFALRGSFPDASLQSDVDSGAIDGPGRWRFHINRMLDEYGLRFSLLFVTRWLGLSPLHEVNDAYEGIDERVVMSEPARIFHEATRDGLSIAAFLRLRFNVIDAQLAGLYGSEHTESTWVREAVTDTLFGTAALSRLYVDLETGNPSPIRRGSFVANRLLCRNLLFPESSVQEEVDRVVDSVPEGLSPPERLAYFRSYDTCATCHRQFDPFGLALEDIGAQGTMRSVYYTGDPVVVEGNFEGQDYTSSTEFVALLADSEAFHHCFASQVHSYVSGSHHLDVFPSISRVPSLHNVPIGSVVSAIVANAIGVEE